jgi:hypothetical protein
MTTESKTHALTDENISAIDAALKKAQARKATREAAEGTATKTGGTAAPKEPRTKVSEEEKTARAQQRATERAARKEKRDAERAAKRAAKAADKKPAHLAKVMRAAEKLSPLGQAAQLLLNEAQANLTAAELANLALHIQHVNRKAATERALGQKLEAGMQVTITGGDPRFIGRTGTVAKAQRIRCYVELEGVKKPVYLFTSDVTAVAAASEAAAG